VLDYANKISRTKRGAKDEIKPEYPEYRILEPVVTDEMAEVGLHLALREPRSAEDIAPLVGKSVEETGRLLWELAMTGAAFVNKIDGVDKYWHDIWVPGHMEMMANHKENVRKFPQIAESFDAYGKRRGPATAGNFPVGLGPMRVIPIEKSIDGETRKASYEEVSRYLNENTVFSVSDCSCRTSREAMGEGCGHLKEDMCIQMGHAAEYYIRTGRGRAITRDEAFEIIRKAEANGLMHSIPNTDGSGKTHAICNCCGCGCFALRIAQMWTNPDMVRSNYVSKVDKEKCVACGECVENCPTNALRLGQKICAKTPVKEKKRDLPYDTEWGMDKWNYEYRTNRKVVLDSGTSPCKAECPAHIGIQGYIKLAAQGKYTEALELIKRENPFPAVCGRICPRKCESACTRGDVDDPVAIDEIKKFIAEQDLNKDRRYVPELRHHYGKKVAVIGAGPAGLACAFYLAIDGYKVTVFEKEKALGGMLTLGIPSFRLGKDVVNAEIDILKELGVEFKTGVEVGKDRSIAELRGEGYKAFYLAIGAQAGRKLGIEGEDAEGVVTGVDLLRRVNLGEDLKLTGHTVVIGGGNVAIDVARTATRIGAAKVDMYCLEACHEMPALPEEIEEAEGEGIGINNSWGPKRILVEKGRVVGVEFKKCVSVFDADKRFSPKYDEAQTMVVKTDNVLLSVGQAMDWGRLLEGTKVELNPNRTVKADPTTFQTAEPDIFAGGDAMTGPRFAIDAIALGKEGAISIHRFVQPGQSLVLGRTKRDYRALDKSDLDLDGYDRVPRQAAEHVDGGKSKATFKDLRGTFTQEQVLKETERCLSCGATVVDEFMCVGCGACTTRCKFDAISLVRKYDAEGLELRELKPAVVKYMVARKLRVTAMKPVKFLKSALSGGK
jgi:NADPH-dependent glutamate synthase beta subunit-like oxidoreductase